jgi:hypothetical protein
VVIKTSGMKREMCTYVHMYVQYIRRVSKVGTGG